MQSHAAPEEAAQLVRVLGTKALEAEIYRVQLAGAVTERVSELPHAGAAERRVADGELT